jgi:nitronate monooxygenase
VKTQLCELLGIEYPIIAAPMGPDLTGPELVAAVSNAGGLGILQAQLAPPPLFRREIQRIRELTDKPFGVNLILHFPVDEQVAIGVTERVPVVSFFWGDPTPYVDRVHDGGGKVFHQVGSVADAQGAAKANVDVIIAQGVEAGGHVAGEVSTLALGAQAAVMGTRFLASIESRAHPEYKRSLLTRTTPSERRCLVLAGRTPRIARCGRDSSRNGWETKREARNRGQTNR